MPDFPKLIQKLKSPNASARYEACEELRVASVIPADALAALRDTVRDPDPEVADAALRAVALHSPPSLPIGGGPTPERAGGHQQFAPLTPLPRESAPPPQAPMPASTPGSPEYVFALERRLIAMEYQIRRVEEWAAQQGTLPETALVSPSFLSRAFAVWGHYFVAQLLIAVPIYFVLYLLVFGS